MTIQNKSTTAQYGSGEVKPSYPGTAHKLAAAIEAAVNGGQTVELGERAWRFVIDRLRGVAQASPEPVAWTNASQLGFLKDPEWAETPMAMWSKRADKCADIPLYAPSLPSTDRVTLPGHDETMANLNALTISPEGK